MKVRDFINELLHENMDDELYIRVMDDYTGDIKFLRVDGLCSDLRSYKHEHITKPTIEVGD